MARPKAQNINDALLKITLAARGYDNCCDIKTSGEAQFLRKLAKENPRICIDVGANTGKYTKFILENSNSDVIAFEPLQNSFEKLKSLELQFPTRLDARNIGVADEAGELELFYGSKNSELATFSVAVNEIDFVNSTNTNSVTTQVITLDSLIEPIISKYGKVDLLKIDTEGFEYNVLAGARKFLVELKPKYIQIEFNLHQLYAGNSLKSISALLPDYRCFQLLPYRNGMVERDTETPESNIFKYSNFIFKRFCD